jgi:YidC/Oxa1 family membrane protein insertase
VQHKRIVRSPIGASTALTGNPHDPADVAPPPTRDRRLSMPEIQKPNQQTAGINLFLAAALIALLAMFFFHPFKPTANQTQSLIIPTPTSAPATPLTTPHHNLLDLLAQPLFNLLNWIHTHIVSNWGWAILILTLLINLLLLPLRIKTMRAQRTTQRLQPEIAAIKEKFKGCKFGDPRMRDMQREISTVQRAHGMGILGNFVPLLIQIPLLYAFYRMLHSASQLHHAPWLWLHDLSAPDPLHILPILFVSTMILQQLLTPAPGADPTQRKLMAIVLPLFYFGITWRTSAGLALYWSFGNMILILQQIIFDRIVTTQGPNARHIPA